MQGRLSLWDAELDGKLLQDNGVQTKRIGMVERWDGCTIFPTQAGADWSGGASVKLTATLLRSSHHVVGTDRVGDRSGIGTRPAMSSLCAMLTMRLR